MSNLATLLVGPLVVPECRRSASRGWVILSRTLAATLIGIIACALGWWAVNQEFDPSYQPGTLVGVTAAAIETIAVILAMVLAPALLAGSLAGEKERGSIGLLLSTRVDAREIVLGRLFGKLSLIGSLLLACLPFQILFGMLNDLALGAQVAVVLLPAAVGLGAGGLSAAASAVARRGRNALMAIYFVEVLFLMALSLAAVPSLAWTVQFLGVLNPFVGIWPLVHFSLPATAYGSIAVWSVLGVVGGAFASLRLRSSYLKLVDGKKERVGNRRLPVPAVSEDAPMIWKERYIEKTNALGWFGRLLSWILVLFLGLGSLGLAGYALLIQQDILAGDFDQTVTQIHRFYAIPSPWICVLIQLAAGLRAAVAVSSERERGTWDGLLTSPLTGREILAGKLRGSLYALVPLLIAAVLAWSICLSFDAMTLVSYVALLGYISVGVIFVVSVGVRMSLATQTATRSMTLTVAALLAAYAVLAIIASLVVLLVMITGMVSLVMAMRIGLIPPNKRPFLPSWMMEGSWHFSIMLGFLILASMIVSEARLRFDKLAGRMPTEGGEPPPKPIWETESASEEKAANGVHEDETYRGSPAVGSARP